MHERAVAQAEAERERLRLAAEQEANRPVVVAPAPPVVVQPIVPVVPVPVPVPAVGGSVQLGGSVSHRRSQQSLTCCINGAYYACPGQEAFETCVSTGPNLCTREPSRDGQCR